MKTYLNYLLFFITINSAFAQLTVRNSSFVYVTDEVVFVEDDVKLNETNSMFYLRDQGQLIQGAGNTGNSGRGKLSVFQSGTAHNYAYNYWCSPVGNTESNDSSNRAFKPSGILHDWTGGNANPIASTASNFTTAFDGIPSPLTISTRWIYQYSSASDYNGWSYVGDVADVPVGRGFTMKGTTGSLAQLYDFRGKPYAGDVSTPVTPNDFTLTGNPYPSALDAVDYIHNPTNRAIMTGTLHFWEHDLTVSSHNVADYIGGYATYTITADGSFETFNPAKFNTYNKDGTLNNTGADSTNPKIINRYIPIGQGFMIEGTGTGNVIMKDSYREYVTESDVNSSILFKGETPKKGDKVVKKYKENGVFIVPEGYQRFRLNIDFDDTYTDQLTHNFHESATDGFDYGLEIKQASDESSEVYFLNPGDPTPLLAQAHQFSSNLRIPLIFELAEQKSIRIRVFDVQNIVDTQDIYVHDIEEDTYHNLRDANFDAVIEAGLHKDKYEITLRDFNATFDVDTNINDNLSVFQNNNNSSLTIMNPNGLNVKDIKIYDITGKRVMKDKNLGNDSQYEFSTRSLSDGTYIVNVKFNDDNKPFSKKIIVSNKK